MLSVKAKWAILGFCKLELLQCSLSMYKMFLPVICVPRATTTRIHVYFDFRNLSSTSKFWPHHGSQPNSDWSGKFWKQSWNGRRKKYWKNPPGDPGELVSAAQTLQWGLECQAWQALARSVLFMLQCRPSMCWQKNSAGKQGEILAAIMALQGWLAVQAMFPLIHQIFLYIHKLTDGIMTAYIFFSFTNHHSYSIFKNPFKNLTSIQKLNLGLQMNSHK